MQRRNALLALAGAAAPLVFRPRHAAAQAPTIPGETPLDSTTYIESTLQVGTLAKTLSQIALQQSSSVSIRSFAQSEILEQTAVAQSLTSNFNPPPAPLTPLQQQIVANLQSLSGDAFNTQYVLDQIQGHEQLLAFQQGYLLFDTDPASDLVHTALLASAFIGTHLLLLQDLGASGHL